MYATVVRVSIKEPDSATQELREKIVPQVSQAPGFVAGYWTRKENTGLSMVIWESEEHARSASERMGDVVPEGVTFEGVEVREVVASA